MQISVALCTFNGELFIEEQLKSILQQSVHVDEIIICDDNSTDKTVELIKAFGYKHERIKLFVNQSNLGISKNFYQAIRKSKGDCVFLSDQDDIWHPDKVQIMVEHMLHSSAKVVFSDAELVNQNNVSLNKKMFDITGFNKTKKFLNSANGRVLVFFENRIVPGATMLIDKEYFTNQICLPDDEFVLHDGWIASYAAIDNKISFVDKPLIRYRQHSGNIIGAIQNTNAATMSLNMICTKNIATIKHFMKNAGNIDFKDKNVLIKHLYLLERLKKKDKHFLSRLSAFSFSYLWNRVNEFYTIRLFIGTWKNYIIGKQ